jgi:pimeloyl-ACP methyl ester carboxylesterase
MRRLSNRAWILLMLAICLAVTASAAGLVLSLHGARAAAVPGPGTTIPAAPGSAQARADLGRMQALLNTGSVSQQAALLAPPLTFASGSGPVVPPGKTITIRPGTLRPDGGQFATVQASVSDGSTVTLGLESVQGHWRLYAVQMGSAQTKAEVTGQPAGVRLLSDPVNPQLDPSTVGKAWPVIFIHGFNQSPNDWGLVGDYYRASMAYQVHAIPGTWVSFFNYGPTSTNWVGDPSNGPALARYVHAVAQASQKAGGPGKVVLVGFSMGGLMARFVAATSMRAADIAMVTTIGTPHEGTKLGDAFNLLCGSSFGRQQADRYLGAGACEKWSAPRGMTSFSADIAALGELPPGIAVHEIAGDETLYKVPFAWATVDIPFHGDIAVPVSSALHKRPGWAQAGDTFDPVTNPHVLGDVSAWHLQLQANQKVIALVTGYVSDWIRKNPPAPVLGGDAYWLAGGGKWRIHGENLVISRGLSGLTGTQTWNAGGQIILGHAQLTFVTQPDGSLVGTYAGDAWYTQSAPQPAPSLCSNCNVYPPSTPEVLKGQTITLVPVAPNLAKMTYNSDSVPPWTAAVAGGSPYWCGWNLADQGRYCNL